MNYCIKQRNRLLGFLARKTIEKYRPGVIAIAGGIGKTSIQEALYTILRDIRDVRATSIHFPSETTVPLAIVGPWTKGSGFIFWMNVIAGAIKNLISASDYPELLLVEYGARKSRGIERLLKIAKPQIAIVGALGNLPSHELSAMIAGLPSNGYGILNYDDPGSWEMKECTRAHIMSFGFDEGAIMRIVNLEHRAEELGDEGYKPLGISFKLACGDALVPVRLDNAFGKAPAYAVAAAACVGTVFGLNLIRIAEAAHYHQTPARRMQLIPGKKGTYLFDDTSDATYTAGEEALTTLQALPARRVIGVFGPLHAWEEDTAEKSDRFYTHAAKVCDLLVLVGEIPALIDKKKILRFDTILGAAHELQGIVTKGDLILIKGHGVERIVQELRSHRLVA